MSASFAADEASQDEAAKGKKLQASRGKVFEDQIFEILESTPVNGTQIIPDVKAITWSELTVAYPNRSTVKIPAGQLTAGKIHALVGPSGSGKSTLAESIGGIHIEADMYFMKDGEYQFDVTKLKDLDLEKKILDLSQKYNLALRLGQGGLAHQVAVALEQYRYEYQVRQREAMKKLDEKQKEQGLDDLINVD